MGSKVIFRKADVFSELAPKNTYEMIFSNPPYVAGAEIEKLPSEIKAWEDKQALWGDKEGAFVSVNCAAIPETLIESELFGYEKGSFTGATGVKKGKFELANKGTLLLDEIGDMPLQLQTRLLRVLEAGKVSRIGGERDITLDVRVIAATHNNLKQKIIDGLFREDLYYRLNILNIHLPPLRERKEDISLLAWNFLQRVLSEVNYKPPYPYLSQQSIQLLEAHNWSGNVRELKNLMTQIAVLLPSGIRKIEAKMIKKALFQHVTRHSQNEEMFQAALTMSLEEVKNGYIQKILDIKKGFQNKSLAKSLGISFALFETKNECNMKIYQAFQEIKKKIPLIKDSDREFILKSLLKTNKTQLYLSFDKKFNQTKQKQLFSMLQRYQSGEPLGYILGEIDFLGMNFLIHEHCPTNYATLVIEYFVDLNRDKEVCISLHLKLFVKNSTPKD